METTTGVFDSRTNAENALHEIRALGVADADISYLYLNSEGKMVNEGNTVGEKAAAGATTGAIIGALAGLVVVNGILPGLGTLFVAGPLATLLGLTGAAATTVAGAATGAAAGGLIGALAGLGVSRQDAAIYEEHVRSGHVLVVIRTGVPGIMEVLKKFGAKEIRQYATT